MIEDNRLESLKKYQEQLATSETDKGNVLHVDREELSREDDDIPDIDEIEITGCEKFENLFCIDKMLGTKEKQTKGNIQGKGKEDPHAKPSDAPEAVKGHKELKHTRWDRYPAPSGTNIGQHQQPMGLQPPLHNILCQIRLLFHEWFLHIFYRSLFSTATGIVPYYLVNNFYMVYYAARLVSWWHLSFKFGFNLFIWTVVMFTPSDLYFQPYIPDSNSKAVGNEDDLLVMT